MDRKCTQSGAVLPPLGAAPDKRQRLTVVKTPQRLALFRLLRRQYMCGLADVGGCCGRRVAGGVKAQFAMERRRTKWEVRIAGCNVRGEALLASAYSASLASAVAYSGRPCSSVA